MRILIAILTSLVLYAGLTSAATEELTPETAATYVSKSSGVVLVDLFAHW